VDRGNNRPVTCGGGDGEIADIKTARSRDLGVIDTGGLKPARPIRLRADQLHEWPVDKIVWLWCTARHNQFRARHRVPGLLGQQIAIVVHTIGTVFDLDFKDWRD